MHVYICVCVFGRYRDKVADSLVGVARGVGVAPVVTPVVHPRNYTLHTTHYTLHTTHYTLHTTHYALHTSHYKIHTTHYTLHTTHCALHTSHYTLHTTHYTLRLVFGRYRDKVADSLVGVARGVGVAPVVAAVVHVEVLVQEHLREQVMGFSQLTRFEAQLTRF